MNDCKVYQMPISVANQHSKKNTQRRVHMPKMHAAKALKFQRTIAKAIQFFIKIAVSVIAAWLTSLWAIPAAYAERGYYAVGGEWILILAAFGFTYWAITKYTIPKRKGALKCRYVENVARK